MMSSMVDRRSESAVGAPAVWYSKENEIEIIKYMLNKIYFAHRIFRSERMKRVKESHYSVKSHFKREIKESGRLSHEDASCVGSVDERKMIVDCIGYWLEFQRVVVRLYSRERELFSIILVTGGCRPGVVADENKGEGGIRTATYLFRVKYTTTA